MLIEQIIFDLSEKINISERFSREDLINSFSENKLENYLNILKKHGLLYEENDEFYFDEEVINRFNNPVKNEEKDILQKSSNKDFSIKDNENKTENELSYSENDIKRTYDMPVKLDSSLNDNQEISIKYSTNKTLDDFDKKSSNLTDIKSKLSTIQEKSNKIESKYWIHKTELSILEDIHKLKQIGSEKPKSKFIKEVGPEDYILLIVNNRGHLDFFGLTKVEEIINIEKRDNSDFYKYYKSDIQLKLKSIRYFNNPIVGADIDNELSFIEGNKKISAYLKTDYKEIPKEDFNKIIKHGHFIKSFPAYFDNVDLNLKDFIMNAILYLYNNLKNKQKSELIEIKVFLHKLTDFINTLGLKIDYDYIVEFYSWNAIELEFTHVPYRDPDKAIPLYDIRGKKKEYAYIDLK